MITGTVVALVVGLLAGGFIVAVKSARKYQGLIYENRILSDRLIQIYQTKDFDNE